MKNTIKLFTYFFLILLMVFSVAYLFLLNSKVINKLDGALWTVPAKVYSRPLVLAEEAYINIQKLILELSLLSYEEVNEIQRPGEFELKENALNIFLKASDDQKAGLFRVNIEKEKIKEILREDGISIDLIRLEPLAIGGMYPSHMQDRLLLNWQQVPEDFIQMLLLIEDRDFFEHRGICYSCIVRAFIKNTKALGIEEGGSTITQQLAKSLFFSPKQTLRRKMKEALAAFFIELHYSKEEILLAYINDVFVAQSGRRAIHGFGLASHFFFGSSLENLSIDQQALLIGMLKGPSLYSPTRNPLRAKQRRDLILSILFDNSLIELTEFNELKNKPLKIIKPTYKSHSKYPYFSDLVILDLKKNFQERDLRTQGLRIYTSLDPILQSLLELSMIDAKEELMGKYGQKLSDLQGAAVVVDSFSGEIKAAIGSIDPKSFGFNRAINAVRPIGSLVKPFVYLTALKQSSNYNLSTLIDDSKLSVPLFGGENWEPNNFDKKYHDLVPLSKALWNSYNIASARLGMELGYDLIEDTFKNLGITKPLSRYPSVFVGSYEMTPIEVAQAYQTIASGGFFSPLSAVREVKSLEREMSLSFPYKMEQRFRPEPMYLLQFILQQTFERGTARGFSQDKIEKWKAGGKTGTSDEQRDSWFAGYAGDYLVIIWLGFDDNRKSPLTGRSGALKVWKKLISQLDPQAPTIRKPSKIEYEWVDLNDGLLSGKDCKGSFFAPFIKGTQPKVIPEDRKKCRVSDNSYSSKIINKIREAIDN